MRKYLLGLLATTIASISIFAFTTNNNAKGPIIESTATKRLVNEKPLATAVFLYISGDVNSPSSYGSTPIAPTQVCSSGSKRCAATFDLDGSGNRTGNPKEPIFNKP